MLVTTYDFGSYFECLLRFFLQLWSCGTKSSSHLPVERCWSEHLSHERGLHVPEIKSILDRFGLFERSYRAVFEHVIQDKILLYRVKPEIAHGDLGEEISFVNVWKIS